MRSSLFCIALVFTFMTLAQAPARAGLELSKMVVDFEPGTPPRQDVEVGNNGEENLYLLVEVVEIIEPQSAQPQRRELTDPRTAGLLVSPMRMIVAPGQRKLLRLVARRPATNRDLIYRVAVVPQAGSFTTEQMGVKVVVGYEMLVIVRPADGRPKVRTVRRGRVLEMSNDGNTNVMVQRVRQCATPDDCQDFPGKRLYAGSSWRLELPADRPVEVLQSYGFSNSVSRY